MKYLCISGFKVPLRTHLLTVFTVLILFFSDDRLLHYGNSPKTSLIAKHTLLCTTRLAGPGIFCAIEK